MSETFIHDVRAGGVTFVHDFPPSFVTWMRPSSVPAQIRFPSFGEGAIV